MALTDPKKSRALGSGPTGTAPGAGTSAPAAGGAAPAPAAPQKQGTGFVNLSSILEANRAGAQKMGQQLNSQVATQGQQAQAGITQAKDTFNTQVSAATPKFNPADATNREAMTTGRVAGYAGPKTWEEAGIKAEQVGTLTTNAARAQDAAQALTSQGGRAALLREQNPGLTAGGASMDAFLSGAGGGQALRDTSAQYSNLSAMLAEARGEAPAAVKEAERVAADTAQQYGAMQDAGWAEDLRQQQNPGPDRAETEQERRLRRNTPRTGRPSRGEAP
jgi:hypothetical protein